MTRRLLTMPLVGLLAFAIAACSSGSAAPTSGGAPTAAGGQPTQAAGQPTAAPTQAAGNGSGAVPCKAIEADVVTAVGKTLGNGDYSDTKCDFMFGGTGDTAGQDGIVNVRLEASTDLNAVKIAFSGGDDVSGVGDAAYWAKGVSVLYSQFHGHVYAVQLVIFSTGTDEKAVATAIMQTLLAHL